MIEERNARLETNGHASSVEFDQNVVRKVCDKVQIHHALQLILERRPLSGVRERNGRLACTNDNLLGRGPMRQHPPVYRFRGIQRKGRSKLVYSFAGEPLPAHPRPAQTQHSVPAGRRQRRHYSTEWHAQTPRHSPNAVPNSIADYVAVIASEKLISSISGERDSYLFSCELGHQERRDLRRVSERLVIQRR